MQRKHTLFFLFFGGAAFGNTDLAGIPARDRVCARESSRRRAAEKQKEGLGPRWAINRQPRSSPRRVCCSWVKVPPVELGGSRRNSRVPVQPRGWRGLSSPGKEPMGRNEDEPHTMSLVMLQMRRRRASGVLREGRCSQETQSPSPANSVGVSVVGTSGRNTSDKRGGPNR